MNRFVVACTAVMTVAAFSMPSAQAQSRFKQCVAQWNALKAANQTEGKTYRAFQKGCLSQQGDLAKQAGVSDVKSGTPEKKQSARAKSQKPAPADAKKTSAGREAANARRRACSAEWKADKAAGKITDGMKWPQYWSACNARKKDAAA